jgi:CubicO group peptidase (beta-lactamase class C family)
VLSILVGIAIDRGLLHLDRKLPELLTTAEAETLDGRASEITLRDLLSMTSGYEAEEAKRSVYGTPTSSVWMARRSVKHAPGIHFHYDNPGTDLISIVLTRAVGAKIEEFDRQELFAPLGIENYKWDADPHGNLPGQSGLQLTARDVAKIGVLYLQQGRWRNRQLVSKHYVIDSTRRHNDGGPPVRSAGYGFLWWTRKTNDESGPYFASGKGGQLIYNVPDRNLVVALLSAGAGGWGVLKFVDDVVLPSELNLRDSTTCADRLE